MSFSQNMSMPSIQARLLGAALVITSLIALNLAFGCSRGTNPIPVPSTSTSTSTTVSSSTTTSTTTTTQPHGWQAKASIHYARSLFAAGQIGNKIYAVGGISSLTDATQHLINTIEVYDPATDTWTDGATDLDNRFAYSSAVVLNGTLYIYGPKLNAPLTPTFEFDAFTPPDTFITLPSPPSGVTNFFGSVGTAGNTIYAFGGSPPSSSQGVTNEVTAFDTTDNTWSYKSPMPTARQGTTVVAIGTDLYVIGGSTTKQVSPATDVVEIYHTATDSWTTAAALKEPGFGGAAAAINNKIYYFGGVDDTNGGSTFSSSFEVYDPAADAWTEIPYADLGRGFGATVMPIYGGQFFYISGYAMNGPLSAITDSVSSYLP